MTSARRALPDIVGPRKKMDGVVRVDPGSVMIVLKNGAPVKVVGTGHSYKRGWRAPLLGELWVIPISTAAHVVDVHVEDVGTMLDRQSNTQFNVPKVSVTFEIQLTRSEDGGALMSYINEQGDNFAGPDGEADVAQHGFGAEYFAIDPDLKHAIAHRNGRGIARLSRGVRTAAAMLFPPPASARRRPVRSQGCR